MIVYDLDEIAPTVTAFSPIDNVDRVSISSNLMITFSEAIQKGTDNILIKDGDVTVQVINGTTITLNGEQGEVIVTVSLAGNDNNNSVSESMTFMVDLTTGIEEELAKVSVFPNPVSNWLTVESATLREISYSIYAQNGFLIDRGNINGIDSNVDVRYLQEGIYLLQLTSQQQSTITKILVNR